MYQAIQRPEAHKSIPSPMPILKRSGKAAGLDYQSGRKALSPANQPGYDAQRSALEPGVQMKGGGDAVAGHEGQTADSTLEAAQQSKTDDIPGATIHPFQKVPLAAESKKAWGTTKQIMLKSHKDKRLTGDMWKKLRPALATLAKPEIVDALWQHGRLGREWASHFTKKKIWGTARLFKNFARYFQAGGKMMTTIEAPKRKKGQTVGPAEKIHDAFIDVGDALKAKAQAEKVKRPKRY